MEPKIQGRIFLVGCPRSATTLLQSLLAAHPSIASFPESHFFTHLQASWPWGEVFGIISPRLKEKFQQFLLQIDQEQMQQRWPKSFRARDYALNFIEILDIVTVNQGKSLWLEKSPEHLNHVDYIEKLGVGAKFIHMIRNGPDVVASLYEATRKYSEAAWGGAWSLDDCIERWTHAVKLSEDHLHKSNHIVIKYEQLVEDPRLVLNELCEFLEIPFDSMMIQEYSTASKGVVRQDEFWKKSVGDKIKNANGQKFYHLFNEGQQQYILDELSLGYNPMRTKLKRWRAKLTRF